MKTNLRQAVRCAVIIGAVVGAVYALILARASVLFNEDTAVSVAAAVRLQPHNPVYLDRLATWQPDNRKALLQRSIAEDRFNYDAWIRLGFMAEMQDGDNAAAEKCYLQAANVNHMFLPRWTLANFYFRQQKIDAFLHWSKETLAVTPYASDPVFAQMWQITQDEETLQSAIPSVPRILLQYVWYLANSKQWPSIPRTVDRLVHLVNKADAGKWGRSDLLAVSQDHMLAAGDLKSALAVWTTLKDAGWIDQSIPDEKSPLTNGDFRQTFYRHGFDWVTNESPGTRVEQYSDAGELHLSLYGDEAEKITLLQQYVVVMPGAHYTMSWECHGEDLNQPTAGLNWHLHALDLAVPDVISGDITDPNPTWEFTAPAGAKAFFLTLEYVRALGTMRTRGVVTLKSVTMKQK